MIKVIKYFFQSLMIYFFFVIGRILGLKKSQFFFSKIFQVIGPRLKSRSVINQNLETFNSKINQGQKNKIISQMWSNYGKTFIEYVFLHKFRKENKFLTIENAHILEKIISKNKPVVFVSGHFANFELMSMVISKHSIKLATIYRPLNNFFLNPFMEFLRKKYVCKNQIKKGRAGVRDAIDYIGRGHSIALMIDQRVTEGEIINLFDKPSLTTTLPAQLALKFKLNIVPVFIRREKNNDFTIKFYKQIEHNKFKDKIEFTKYLNSQFESMLIRNPEQWIWTHNRWKL